MHKPSSWSFWTVATAFLAGFTLSVLAFLRLCTESCAETHNFFFFGLPFEPIGLVFFSILGILHYWSRKQPNLSYIVTLMVFCALGAEVWFIAVQKLQIGIWCPVCLSIAASLLIAGIVLGYNQLGDRNMKIKNILSLSTILIGFSLAFFGVAKTEAAGSKEFNAENPLFGNKKSNVQVYIVTDWFCPACHGIEPTLEKLYPRITARAGLTFIDMPIHPESMNYVPYNLAFMLKEPHKYFKIRKELQKLSNENKAPSEEQIEAAVASLKVKYKQLNYADVDSGINFNEQIIKRYEIKSTPIIIIANKHNGSYKTLKGASEITEKKVIDAINEMSKAK